jgi:hypothetical protein
MENSRNYLISGLIVCCFLYSSSVSSQTINHAFQDGSTSSYNIVSLNSRSYYLEKTNRIIECCSDRISLVGRDANGNFLFRTPIAKEAWMQDCMVRVSTDNTLLVLAGTRMRGCDYGGTRYTVCKTDTNGTVIWTSTLSIDADHIVPWTSGSYFLLGGDTLYRFSAGGGYISKSALGTSTVSAVTRLASWTMLLSYNGSSGPRFRVIDSTGATVTDVSAPFAMQHLAEGNDQKIYASSVFSMHRFSPALNLLGSSVIPSVPGLTIADFMCASDSLYVTGHTSGNIPKYVLLDSSFNVLHQSASNLENARCSGITVNSAGKVTLVTWYNLPLISGLADHGFSGFFSIPKAGHLNMFHDIAVSDIVTFTANYTYNQGQYYGIGNASVKIRNAGADTISSFHLNHLVLIQGIAYCYIGLEKEYNVKIKPGDSAIVATGTFNLKPYYAPPPASLLLCIRCSVPNRQNDINTSNDELCEYISIVVSSPDLQQAKDVSVSPNPGQEITVTSPEFIDRLDVISPSGAVVRTYELADRTLVLSEPEGLYILRIETGGRVLFKKVVFIQ